MAANPETAVAVITEQAPTVYNLDEFPEAKFNRIIPTQTIRMPSDLLVPVIQIVQLDPADRDGKSADHYKSNDIPAGHRALTARGLNKVATASAVSFYDEHRVDDGKDPDVIGVTVMAELLLPTGQKIRAPGTKWVNLNLQTMTPAQKGKFKSFFYEHVSTRARSRAIRALLSLKSSYTDAEVGKPFAVVSFAPNMNHPLIQQRMVDNLAPAVAQLYGGAGGEAAAIGPGTPVQDLRELPADDEPAATPAPAASSTDEPAWMAAADPSAKPEPTFIEKLQANAAAASVEGPMTEEQVATLGPLLGPVRAIIGSVVRAAWGEEATKNLTAAQAAAIIALSNTFEADTDFHAAWTAASEATKAAAA